MKTGFYPNMSKLDYLKVEALSNSGLKKLVRSPAHFKAPAKPITTQKQTTFDIGTAFHTATLEPELYNKEVTVTDASTVTAKQKNEAAKEGKIILKRFDHDNVMAMAKALQNHPDSEPLIKEGGVTEISCFWEDPDYGFLCKLRADKITDSQIVVDLKSTEDAEDQSRGFGSFFKNFFSLKYHWQAYWYLNGLSLATEIPHDIFAFIAAEKHAPHEGINVFIPDRDVLLWAMEEIEPIKARYAKCLETGVWPCYETGIKTIGLQAWMKKYK